MIDDYRTLGFGRLLAVWSLAMAECVLIFLGGLILIPVCLFDLVCLVACAAWQAVFKRPPCNPQ